METCEKGANNHQNVLDIVMPLWIRNFPGYQRYYKIMALKHRNPHVLLLYLTLYQTMKTSDAFN